jgi:hypothetical protein
MGKDSLIKSTAKKKTKSAKDEEAKKKTATKAATKPKKAAKPKAAKKAPVKTAKAKTSAAQPKTKTATAKPGVKKSASPAKPEAKAVSKKTRKATIPELLAKKFDSLPGAPKPKPAATPKKIYTESPPFVSPSDPSEADRMRTLLMTKFSMAEIKAAAKPPEPETPEAAAPKASERETPSATAIETPPAPADEPPVMIPPAVQEDAPEPISRAIKYGIAAAVLLVLVLLAISNNNSSKYYLYPKEGAIEIWKGRFSPKDKKYFMVLHGVQLEKEVKAVYSQSEVYPMIFDYYLDKADTLLEVSGLPDFDGIKNHLYQAQSFATTPETKNKVKGRLNAIERMILLYRVDVAISKNTQDSLKAALKDLQKVSGLVANPSQQQEIDEKIARVKQLQTEIQSMPK